ncbi:ATP-binding protein [Tritonibacter sp. SIMBA_163]|uniref:ATP-binding protein n=1 Tax=Tritonibacter sp. SIMBA_163 TaxID=3080868 RepID=UPI003981859D
MTLRPEDPLVPERASDDPSYRDLLIELERERERSAELESQLERKSQSLRRANGSLVALARQVDRMVKERTEDLARDRAEAEAESAAKTQFLATMSHEIRTPLNGVLGMASALADTTLVEEQAQILDVLRESGRLLLSIVDDILDLSKIEEGKLELERLPIDVVDLLDAVCRQFQPRMEAKGLDFTRLYGGALSAGGTWVNIDPTRFQQVLTNLLSNAAKFTDRGAITLTADLTDHQDGTLILSVTVRDTGVGLSQAQVERLFQPYVQADASVHRNHGGTGLGLAISRQICLRMGGELECRSAMGDGSEFCATFRVSRATPLEKTPEPDQKADVDVIARRRWRVLVAEDNRTNRMVLHHILRHHDLDLLWVENGEQAVEACRRVEPDLVLMDVNMPLMDGVTAAGQVRAEERAQDRTPVPIIAVSANALVHQVRHYLESGMNYHVAKPIRKDRLLRVMAQALLDAPIVEDSA